MKKFVIILDALKKNKIEIIKNILNTDIEYIEVIPPFTFEPDASYLCGKNPEDSNAGLKYWKRDNNNLDWQIKFINLLPNKPYILRKFINYALSKINFDSLKSYKNSYGHIPFHFLKYFELSKPINLFKKTEYPDPITIFNFIEKEYLYFGVPYHSGKIKTIKKLINFEKLKNYDLIFLYISDLDATGHKYGGNSSEYDNKLKEIFIFLKEIFNSFNNNVSFVIFGDHGMTNVSKYIDIEKILKKLPLTIKKDYIYFLDSTMARFWFFNNNAKKIIFESLSQIKDGSWITDEDKNIYKINYKHNKFGDAIWWVNEGNSIISPNFWQGNKKLKGMHGYKKEVSENHTCIISNKVKFNDKTYPLSMIELFEILKDFIITKNG
jgi:predicted AlkP superfamily pyrophosphatase or phosphodiesterase